MRLQKPFFSHKPTQLLPLALDLALALALATLELRPAAAKALLSFRLNEGHRVFALAPIFPTYIYRRKYRQQEHYHLY
jgi:hypothetical protein